MRWDRLFADLEGQAEDAALQDRDALVAELSDEQWGSTSWRSLAGGHVELDVLGAGGIAGEVVLVNETLLHLTTASMDHVVAARAVLALRSASRRADPVTQVTARLDWRQVLRRARQDGDELRAVRTDGIVVEGQVDVVGQDFVTVLTGAARRTLLPLTALAVVSLRR